MGLHAEHASIRLQPGRVGRSILGCASGSITRTPRAGLRYSASMLLLAGEANIRLGRLQVWVKRSRCGKGVRWSHRSRGPPALNCDAPRMGNPIEGMRSALPSGKPTNRSGRPRGPLRDAGRGSHGRVLQPKIQ